MLLFYLFDRLCFCDVCCETECIKRYPAYASRADHGGNNSYARLLLRNRLKCAPCVLAWLLFSMRWKTFWIFARFIPCAKSGLILCDLFYLVVSRWFCILWNFLGGDFVLNWMDDGLQRIKIWVLGINGNNSNIFMHIKNAMPNGSLTSKTSPCKTSFENSQA